MSRSAAEFLKPQNVASTHYLDNRVYWDHEIFEEEKKRIFSKVWKFVCHVSEIPSTFDYRTIKVADTPLVVIRGKDEKVRTFVNACSHRGIQIVRRPRGNAKTMECIFHRWNYDSTNGELTGAPRKEAYGPSNFDLKQCGLREVRTETYLGLVFVNLDDSAVSLSEFIGDALEMEKDILGAEELEVFDYYEQVLDTNWKNWQETNLDLYHEFMHFANRKTGLTVKEYYQRAWKLYPNGHAAIERYRAQYSNYAGWQDRDERIRLPGLHPNEFQVVNLFPDLAINARGTVIRIDSQTPISPGKTLVQYRGLGLKRDSERERVQRVRDYTSIWGPFGTNLAEDTLATSLHAKTIQTGSVPFTYLTRDEGGMTQDDLGLRTFYREWERLMSRQANQIR